MDESELTDRFTAELTALEQSGAVLPLALRPSEAWYLLAALQLALRHPGMKGGENQGIAKFIQTLAENIQGRLCRAPVMQEIARRGWIESEDIPVKSESEPKKKPVETPQNKSVEAPENKEARPPKRKRP
jgi:hypothetical protein